MELLRMKIWQDNYVSRLIWFLWLWGGRHSPFVPVIGRSLGKNPNFLSDSSRISPFRHKEEGERGSEAAESDASMIDFKNILYICELFILLSGFHWNWGATEGSLPYGNTDFRLSLAKRGIALDVPGGSHEPAAAARTALARLAGAREGCDLASVSPRRDIPRGPVVLSSAGRAPLLPLSPAGLGFPAPAARAAAPGAAPAPAPLPTPGPSRGLRCPENRAASVRLNRVSASVTTFGVYFFTAGSNRVLTSSTSCFRGARFV